MADVKISALPSISNQDISGVLPIVISGVTQKISVGQLLVAPVGSTMALAVDGQGEVVVGSAGAIDIRGNGGDDISITQGNPGIGLIMTDVGGILIQQESGQDVSIANTSGNLFLGGASAAVFIAYSTLSFQYTPSVPADWANPDPTDLIAAVNRIASALRSVLPGAIP